MRKEKIVIIDDDPDILDVLQLTLTEHYTVFAANNGKTGLELVKNKMPDLIITDYMMPVMNGPEFCRHLRNDILLRHLPVIMLTGKGETKDMVTGIESGADDYLIKPFSLEELLARMRALLRRPQQIQGEVLSVDDLTLNTKSFKAWRGKKEIYLTRKEFMLLEYLLRSQNIVLSRGMILEHVWNMDTDPFSNTIESHILSLRKKIDIEKKKKLIRTVPGRGYTIY